ncbi:diguanylate cyclase (GGDEF)-like protein/PAS domain S-box-containing protein [Salirhabdus euzebyi]|uniref:Diguanylate cyclase (GGDEF)-like protein/PAS domain S-box-containing protein n=1 Tax=Salirhabdus euzebyi TaxID=394506 RepID=A0A841Q436_9BACI|nr:diguanylate cyclase [Salirhabdus euzebyi]MBB6453100.1 diguanylate cyclase (GGDEF)-like protein/PAS domain S-box-containing protein [Salirhabdus euzebyi]
MGINLSSQSLSTKEKRTITFSFLIIMVYFIFLFSSMSFSVFHADLSKNDFLSLHILLEIISISVAYAIAFTGLLTYPYTASNHRLYIGAVFFVVGTLDLFHTLSYTGMPIFITESSVMHSTWFRIIARLTEALFLLIIISRKNKHIKIFKPNIIFSLASLYAVFIIYNVYRFTLPILESNEGITQIALNLEYFIIVFHLLTIFILLRQYIKEKDSTRLTFIIGFVFLLLSEVTFTLYESMYDFINILRHVYKAFGFYFILKGVHDSTIQEPYKKEQQAQLALRKSENRYRRLIEESPDANFVHRDGIVIYLNEPTARILKMDNTKQLIGRSVFDFIDHEDHEKVYEGIKKTRETNEKFEQTELKAMNSKGEKIIIEVSAIPITFDEEAAIHVIFRDITKRKEMERNLQKLNEELQKLSAIDGLTNIPNRRYFDNYLQKQWDHAKRNQASLSLIMLDIDFFKKYNDTYGHLMGDTCLKKVAASIQHKLYRSLDVVARYGGEEFAVILPETKLKDALAIAERIRRGIESLHISHASSEVSDDVTISIGVASLIPRDSESVEMFITTADQALYRAKNNGRNQVQYNQDLCLLDENPPF